MFALDLEGLDEANSWLGALPDALARTLAVKAAELAATLADRVRAGPLAGGALNIRTGALQASIVSDVSAAGDGLRATVGSDGDVKYAAIQEYGGKTSAHEILPVKAEALAFAANGALRFARKIAHPGSLIPERSYLRATLGEMSDDIVAGLADAAAESLERR